MLQFSATSFTLFYRKSVYALMYGHPILVELLTKTTHSYVYKFNSYECINHVSWFLNLTTKTNCGNHFPKLQVMLDWFPCIDRFINHPFHFFSYVFSVWISLDETLVSRFLIERTMALVKSIPWPWKMEIVRKDESFRWRKIWLLFRLLISYVICSYIFENLTRMWLSHIKVWLEKRSMAPDWTSSMCISSVLSDRLHGNLDINIKNILNDGEVWLTLVC